MTVSKQKHSHYSGIKKSFEKALHTYDYEAIIQRQASQLLIDSLIQIRFSPKKVLDLGCGTGHITARLCEVFPISSLHINDFSERLLEKASLHLQSLNPVRLPFNFDQEWHYTDLYDLIFSNMALQWSFNIHAVLKKCHNHLNNNAFLAFSLPLKGSFVELNTHQRIPFHTYDKVYQALTTSEFDIVHADQLNLCQEFKTHLQALKSIKRCGANYVPQNTPPKLIDRLKLYLPSTLTYRIGIFIATKRIKDENLYNWH